ncbi:PAAR domain-containing protein [Acinetobacter stercoris]|uniref:PAAR motif protein n=1 Tax=Acinetobacter stercoris TaxID=2126983 RepID=A0A2U3N4T9_9GAMM|nr:PAAR domain-containing protein [Acinetobacter stercoris]SPL72579.1 PAAR motif protein [Acinetobacter stercoris]
MATPYITIGCPTTGGGVVLTGQDSFKIEGIPAACIGDKATCPLHKTVSTIISGDQYMKVQGKPMARAGDGLSCGCKLLPKQSLVVGDNGGGARANALTSQMLNNQQNTNNNLVEDKGLLNGYYYNVDTGIFEGKITNGTGQIEDLYACNGKDGNDYKNKKKLDMTHSDFQKNAFILAEEAGDPGQECVCLGFTASNRAKELSWKLFKLLLTPYSSVPKSQKGTLLSPSKTDTKSNNIRKGLLQFLAGYDDPTQGATFWDGTDFLAWGLKSPFQNSAPHAKFREYKKITIDKNIYEKYKAATLKVYPKGKVVYTKYNYASSVPSQDFLDPKNWTTGNFIYITNAHRASKSIIATVCEGHTLFWKTY